MQMNTMARSCLLLVVVAAVLVPVPLASSAPLSKGAAAGIIGRVSIRLRPVITKSLGKALKEAAAEAAKELAQDFLFPSGSSSQANTSELEEGSKSASNVGLLVFNLSIGTSPPQDISGILDITSQLLWSQCAPCSGTCPPPPAPTFLPTSSATFTRLPCGSQTCQQVLNQSCADANGKEDDSCGYIGVYGEEKNTTGYLATDTFTFDGAQQVPGLVFGCSVASAGDYSGASGVFGFGKGPLSLVSQLQLSWFSYYWASDDSDGSSLFEFGNNGSAANSTQTRSNSRSTPFLTNNKYPELYFVKLTGVRVDDQPLAGIPAGTFDLQANGSGGVWLSTTTAATFLERAAYDVVRQALATSINAQPVNGSALDLDLCYTTKSLKTVGFPKLALVFDGVDAVMQLQRDNFFFSDSETGLDCLTILPSLGGSLLGSLLQTGRNMTYDIANAQLIFDTEAHTAAAASPARPLASLNMMMILYLAVWQVVMLF